MTEANIYALNKTIWQKAFPKLLETIVARNNRIHVFCDDAGFMQELDELIWTFEQLSFVPHATEKDEMLDRNPIVLSVKEDNFNKANILAITGKKRPANLLGFEKLIYMYHETDRLSREVANDHITAFNAASITCNHFKQNGSGSWERSLA